MDWGGPTFYHFCSFEFEFWSSPNFPTRVVVGLEAAPSDVEVRFEGNQKVVGGGDNARGLTRPAVVPQVAVGDCRAIKQGHKVEIAALVVLQLEVQEDQSDDAGVGHTDGPRAVGIIAVLHRVTWARDFTRQTS